MKTNTAYSIKYVALKSGVKPYLIRSWESRYSAICPQRSDSNRRCFSDADIRRLRLLRQAIEEGHTISSVAGLADDDLQKLVARSATQQIQSDDRLSQPTTAADDSANQIATIVSEALSHTQQLDATSLERVLSDAAVELPRHAFLEAVVLPFFKRIGELWRKGQMKTLNEHMASVVVRSILWDMLRSTIVSEQAPIVVVSTPIGHWHEFGALASALAASESGWRTAYFGPNLPSDEIAYAVRKCSANALALSLCHGLNDNRLVLELKKVRRLVGAALPIFVGGPGALAVQKTIEQIKGIVSKDLSDFRGKLEALAENKLE
ncbi:MAG: MerR family transcriptional regulator [Desulfosarcina sp.]|jgi:DNA-binding transcriptional MerR regulator